MLSSGGSEETRIAILKAAWTHLKTEGIDGFSMATIAREAGVSRQAVYLHFGNRAGLLLALVQHADETLGLFDLLKGVEEAETPVRKVEALLAVTAQYAPKIQAVAAMLERERLRDEDAREAWEDRMESRRKGLRLALERVDAAEGLREPWTVERAVDALWVLGLPTVYQSLVEEGGWTSDQYEWFMIDTFHGMRRR